jgi:exopolysaccharide production protein ExoQ
MKMNNYNPVGAIYLLPFTIFFLVSGLSLLQSSSSDNQQLEGSVINQIFLSFAYGLAFILLLRRRYLFGYFLARAYPLLSLLFFILCSIMWSAFPRSVLISFVHQLGVLLIAMVTVMLLLDEKDKFFKLLLSLLFVYLLATAVISLIFPNVGQMPSSRWITGGQWRGLTVHSNNLGMLCLITTWVATSSYFLMEHRKKLTTTMIFLVVMLAFYCLYRTNSMTSTVLSTSLLLSVIWFSFISTSSGSVKAVKTIFFIFFILLMIAIVVVINPDLLSVKTFFKIIGRNETLTGRTSLWEIGLKGFSERPYLGWSFDNLRSFFKRYSLGYGQLHNGYLDLMVRGGLASLLLLMVMIFQLAINIIKLRNSEDKRYYFILSGFIAILIHNITEASFLRNTNTLWLMFLVLYFYGFACIYQKTSKVNH